MSIQKNLIKDSTTITLEKFIRLFDKEGLHRVDLK